MAAGTLVSRILGFVKTILLTVAIGSLSTVGDVFKTANTLPNLIYVLVAGGVFNAVLVPQIIKAAKAQDGGARYISKLVTLTVTAIGLITLITVACAWPIISIMGSGWSPEQRQLGFIFSLWCLPQIFFYGLYTVIGQVLNAKDAFGAYMWSPVLNNVITILSLILFIFLFGAQTPNPNPIHTVDNWTNAQTLVLAGSSTFGVIMQALVLFIPLRKLGLRLKPDFAWRGIGLRAASKLAAWTLASGIISNLAFLYMTKVAAGIVGQREHYAALGIQIPGLQALNYASMLYMLPHGVIGISIATVLFNRMSASAIADDSDSVIYALSHGLRNAAVATVFCMVALMVLAGPVAVLFSGGDPIAATIIAKLIVITALGTPTPASLLDAQYTVYMLAFIYPVHNILIMFISHHMVRRRLGYYGQRGIVSAYARTTLASLFAGGIAAIALWLLGGYQLDGFAWASKLTAIITLAVCGTVMGLAYLAGIQIFRVKEANALLAPLTSKLERFARR